MYLQHFTTRLNNFHVILFIGCSKRVYSMPLVLQGSSNGECIGCGELSNCSTWDGSIQLRGYRLQRQSEEMNKELHFPHLREITGHLLIYLLYEHQSLKDIFPNLSVIRGRTSLLFLDYALVIYQNNGLKEVNLPSLNVILGGGVRIEKNINLCYVNTVRWKSIMKASGNDRYAIATSSNNNDCYDMCYKDQCYPPAGHGVSGKQYCWSPGTSQLYYCQKRKYNIYCVYWQSLRYGIYSSVLISNL